MTDLRIASVFEVTDTWLASGCSPTPGTITVWYTAGINSTYYEASSYEVTLASSTNLATATFPGLTSTDLYPGEAIIMVNHIDEFVNNIFRLGCGL